MTDKGQRFVCKVIHSHTIHLLKIDFDLVIPQLDGSSLISGGRGSELRKNFLTQRSPTTDFLTMSAGGVMVVTVGGKRNHFYGTQKVLPPKHLKMTCLWGKLKHVAKHCCDNDESILTKSANM